VDSGEVKANWNSLLQTISQYQLNKVVCIQMIIPTSADSPMTQDFFKRSAPFVRTLNSTSLGLKHVCEAVFIDINLFSLRSGIVKLFHPDLVRTLEEISCTTTTLKSAIAAVPSNYGYTGYQLTDSQRDKYALSSPVAVSETPDLEMLDYEDENLS